MSAVPDKCLLHFIVNTIPEHDIESLKKRITDFIEESKKNEKNTHINKKKTLINSITFVIIKYFYENFTNKIT